MTTDPTRENYLKGSLTVKIVIDQRQVGILQADDIVDCYFIEDKEHFNNQYHKLIATEYLTWLKQS